METSSSAGTRSRLPTRGFRQARRCLVTSLPALLLVGCALGPTGSDDYWAELPALTTTTTVAPIEVTVSSTYAVTSANPAMDQSITSPEKLTWWHDGHWWMLADGWYAFRRDPDGTWIRAGFVIGQVARRADVQVDPITGDITVYASRSRPGGAVVGRASYDPATETYVSPAFYGQSEGTAPLPDWDRATHTIDSSGRMWVTGRDHDTGELHYMALDPASFGLAAPVLRDDSVLTADVSSESYQPRIVAFSDVIGSGVGVLVDNQTRGEMQFWRRYDFSPIGSAWAMETVTRSHFDDHGDVTSTPHGDVLAVFKSRDAVMGEGSANIIYARRTAQGEWVDEVIVAKKFGGTSADEWTKPQISYDAQSDRIWIAARKQDASGELTFWAAPRLAPAFVEAASTQLAPGVSAERMSGSASPLTSETGLYVVARNGSDWYGVLVDWE